MDAQPADRHADDESTHRRHRAQRRRVPDPPHRHELPQALQHPGEQMISRDWRCLAASCGSVFHSYDANPECPQCGNVRVTWVPGGGHVMAKAPGIDRTVRQLADNYGMSDVNSPSPSRLNRAMPQAARAASGPAVQFAPGFAAPIDM